VATLRVSRHSHRKFVAANYNRFFRGFEHASIKILTKHNIPFMSSDFELQDELVQDYLRRRQKPSREGGRSGKLRFHFNFYDLLSITEEEVANYQTEYWKVGAVHSEASEPSKHGSLQHGNYSRRYLSQCAWSVCHDFFFIRRLKFTDTARLLHASQLNHRFSTITVQRGGIGLLSNFSLLATGVIKSIHLRASLRRSLTCCSLLCTASYA